MRKCTGKFFLCKNYNRIKDTIYLPPCKEEVRGHEEILSGEGWGRMMKRHSLLLENCILCKFVFFQADT